jgi:RecA-family ATPase
MSNRKRATDSPDIAIARELIQMDVPIFVAARADEFPTGGTGGDLGYHLPPGWQQTEPDESVLDDYWPGDALCALMGTTFDVLDTDPRHGGDDSFDELVAELERGVPTSYATALTPSGGWHDYLAALNIGKHTGWRPGLDLQGGRADGTSGSFVFLPPTERKSKADGKVYPYLWDEPPERPDPDDASGESLAQLILDAVAGGRKAKDGGKGKAAPDGDGRLLTRAQIRRYRNDGIPEDEGQDNILSRCCWAWRFRNTTRKAAYARWQEIVSKTTLTEPGRPFTQRDFNRHWKGADAHWSEQEQDTQPDDDDGDENGTLVFTKASDVPMRAVEWVWQDRLPRGTFCLSAGAGGAGKSLAAVWKAAKMTRGALPGCFFGEEKQVIWATLEASPEVEVAPRLAAAGANMEMVEFVTVRVSNDRADDHIRIFDPAYIEQLRDRVRRGNVGMVVLDPALDVLSGRINSKEQSEVRAAIARIHAFAESTGILVHGIAHFNKLTTVDDAMLRITGSAAWGQRVRAALVFAFDEEEQVFVLSQGKNNWGRTLDLPNLAFVIETEKVRMANGKLDETIKLAWTEDSEADVNSLLARKRSRGDGSKLEEAEQFLFSALSDGPVKKETVYRMAEEENIKQSTLEKAARKMKIKTAAMPATPGKLGRRPVMMSLPEGPWDDSSI